MRVRLIAPLLTLGLLPACADVSSPSALEVVSVVCRDSASTTATILPWELEVSPDPVESGQAFSAVLDGVMVASEDLLNRGQILFTHGFREVNLIDLKATVRVRKGATGPPVVLRPTPIPYTCFEGRSACDHDHDLPGVPGLRGNTDCEPVGPSNPCGRFIAMPVSDDCSPSGLCAKLGKTAQCDKNGFCTTGSLRIELDKQVGHYEADTHGEVLFGWDETGATAHDGGENDGGFDLPFPDHEEPTASLGFRVSIPGEPFQPAAFDCVMGADCANPLLGLGCEPLPDQALVSFPIRTELP